MTSVRQPLAHEPMREVEPFSVDGLSSEMQETCAWECVSAGKHPFFLEVVPRWRMNHSQKVVEFGKEFPQNQKKSLCLVLHD